MKLVPVARFGLIGGSLCKLPPSLPPARVKPRAGPARFWTISRESGESADEFGEVKLCAQVQYLGHICSESNVFFSIKLDVKESTKVVIVVTFAT